MKSAPFFIIGFTLVIIGLATIPLNQYPGFGWVPYAQASLGAILITIKLIWVWRHRV